MSNAQLRTYCRVGRDAPIELVLSYICAPIYNGDDDDYLFIRWHREVKIIIVSYFDCMPTHLQSKKL